MKNQAICAICGKELALAGLHGHLKFVHGIETPKKNSANLQDTGKFNVEITKLNDSLIAKNYEIESLQGTIVTKESEIVSLRDSLKQKGIELYDFNELFKAKQNELVTLHDELAELSSLEHKQNIVRNTLRNLTKEQYDLIGQQLGFVKQPTLKPTTTAPVEDNKPVEHEPEFFIGKKEGDGWEYREFLGFSVKY